MVPPSHLPLVVPGLATPLANGDPAEMGPGAPKVGEGVAVCRLGNGEDEGSFAPAPPKGAA